MSTEAPNLDALTLPDVAFIGKAGAGKTSAADILVRDFGYTRASFAAPLKDIAAQIWGEGARTDRDKLQRLGVAVRDIDADAWARLLVRTVQDRSNPLRVRSDDVLSLGGSRYVDGPPKRWVVDDCRFPNEHALLAEAGFVFARVWAPEILRIDRLKANGKLQDEAQLQHVSETALDHIRADYDIENDLGHDDLDRELVTLLNREARKV